MRLSWIKPSIWKVFLFFELCDVSLRTDKRVSPSMLAPLTWDDRMACVLKIPGSPISAAPATSTRAASDVWTAGATGAEKDMWMDQWKVITYHLYIFSIWDEHLFTSHFGDQRFIYSTSFCRFWSWKYIYKMSLKTYFGLVSSQVSTVVFFPPNSVFLSQRGHIAGPPAAVAVQRAMVSLMGLADFGVHYW